MLEKEILLLSKADKRSDETQEAMAAILDHYDDMIISSAYKILFTSPLPEHVYDDAISETREKYCLYGHYYNTKRGNIEQFLVSSLSGFLKTTKTYRFYVTSKYSIISQETTILDNPVYNEDEDSSDSYIDEIVCDTYFECEKDRIEMAVYFDSIVQDVPFTDQEKKFIDLYRAGYSTSYINCHRKRTGIKSPYHCYQQILKKMKTYFIQKGITSTSYLG